MPQACPNESGECSTKDCNATEAAAWYGKKGSKYCKHCYDTALGPKKRGRPTPTAEQELEQAGDTLVEIIKICGIRCARALEPAPASAHARR